MKRKRLKGRKGEGRRRTLLEVERRVKKGEESALLGKDSSCELEEEEGDKCRRAEECLQQS